MIKNDINDTIAAPATPAGSSGIGIVRISGRKALDVADRIFLARDGKKASGFKSYTIHYGRIVQPQSAEVIDEVILTVMRAPRSYTKEDVVEINCHGGIVALRKVLELALENGCRLAEPGEFTKRAYLYGRIDLAQAEAVLDIINAKTDAALKLGQEQLGGALSSRISNIRQRLLDILAELEANIDFPDEGLGAFDLSKASSVLSEINNEFTGILRSSVCGRILREGVHVVICGRPNVGKSSLLNALLSEERSIVTHIAGTTRDTIEEIIDIRGIPVRIVDTAGIIEPRDLVEKKAVQRARKQIDMADLVLLVFDASSRLTKDERGLIAKLKNKRTIAVINKIDVKGKIEKDEIARRFGRAVEISAKKLKNIGLLEEAIAGAVYHGSAAGQESLLLSNSRHIAVLKGAQKFIAQALNSLDNKLSPELIAQDIKDALGSLDEILGRAAKKDLLDRIFAQFCIGK